AVPALAALTASCGPGSCLHSAARALRILGRHAGARRAAARAGAAGALASRLASLPPSHPSCCSVARALRALSGELADAELAGALPALAAAALTAGGKGGSRRRAAALGAMAAACSRAALRPALGAAGAVEAVVGELRRSVATPGPGPPLFLTAALCLLCREAVNRARVRAAGGLGLLLALLGDPRARPARPRVLLALAAFAYDPPALEALDARGLVPLLVDVLRGGGEDDADADDDDDDEGAASFDLPDRPAAPTAAPGAAAGSLRGLKSWLLSEAVSPPPSPPEAPEEAPDGRPERRRRRRRRGDGRVLGALALPPGAGEPRGPEAPALLLLGRLAAAEEPSRALATAPVVAGLLRYLVASPAPASRALRVLQRLTGHPGCLGPLVGAYVPSLLRSWLVLGVAPGRARRLCRPDRGAGAGPRDPRHERLKELGEGLLRNLGAVAASPFGVGLLTHTLRCGAPPARLACATALPLLARAGAPGPARGLLWGAGGAGALLVAAVARGPASPFEPPPAFAFYAADALGALRGHGARPAAQASPRSSNTRPRASPCPPTSPRSSNTHPQVSPCPPASPGSSNPRPQVSSCSPPPPGSSNPRPQVSPCSPPSPGSSNPRPQVSSCSPPPPGSSNPRPQVSSCSPPPPGSSNPRPQVSACSPPPPGSSNPRPQVSSCSPPPPGSSNPRPQVSACSPPPPGSSNPRPQVSACSPPSPGSSNPRPQVSSCSPPPPGSSNPRPQVSPCSPPPPGSSNPRPQVSPCSPPSPGSSNPHPAPSLRSSNPRPQVSACSPPSPGSSNPHPAPSLRSSSPRPQASPCPPPSPRSSNAHPQVSPCPPPSLRSSNPHPQVSPCSPPSPGSSNAHPQASPCPPPSPRSSNPHPQVSPCSPPSPGSSNPHPPPSPRSSSPRPQASPRSSTPRPPNCPYARASHDLLLLPDGTEPGLGASREALTRGSPVLGAMLGGAFAEARQGAVTLRCAPRLPLLLLLHYVHGCRPAAGCPRLRPPIARATAGATITLARRYLVPGLEAVMAAGVSGPPDVLWALAERWACGPLATRAARELLTGPPQKVAPRLVQVTRAVRCPNRLARALLTVVAPRGHRPRLDMGEPLDGGDPLLRFPGEPPARELGDPLEDLGEPLENLGNPLEDLGNPLEDLRDSVEDLGEPVEDLGDPVEDLGDLGDPVEDLGDPLEDLGDPLEDLEDPLEDLEEPLEDLGDPLEDLEEPAEDLEDPLEDLEDPAEDLGDPPEMLGEGEDAPGCVRDLSEKEDEDMEVEGPP
ncbi:armadillo repeat-containing protein 5, partial [Rhea pennata]|uniref:armadillo repeat-containing protein 5 n=1 Tax=Rhea pennata TaxID=8795 RepID=UPI002E26EBC5